MEKQLFKAFLLLALIFVSLPSLSFASVLMGTITLKVGEEYYANASYSATTTVQSGTWTKSNSNIVFVSQGQQTCKVRANRVGTSKLSYRGTAAPPNSWSVYTIDCYWTINVVSNGSSGGSGGGSDKGNDDKKSSDSTVGTYTGEIPTDDWSNNGNYSISWYNNTQDVFTLSTAKELAGMALLINNGYTDFKGKTVKLNNDIDLSGKKWNSPSKFCGTFDGNGKTITGVYMQSENENQLNFGFFKTLNQAKTINVTIKGVGNFECKKYLDNNNFCYAGGLVGNATKSKIQGCKIEMDLYFKGGVVDPDFVGTIEEWLRIGGVCGKVDSVSNCSFLGKMHCILPKRHNYLLLGGIAAYAQYVEYSEVISPLIYIKDYDETKNFISGISNCIWDENSIKYCRSIIDTITIKGYLESTRGWFKYNISGIGDFVDFGIRQHNATITNCYSSINHINVSSESGKKAYIYYGSITYKSSNTSLIANFSNNDAALKTNASIEKGNDGSTSFSSDEMKTSAFLEELNLYSTLNMDGPIWAQDSNGGYPYIKKLYETSGISNNVRVSKVRQQGIYDLSGRKLNKLQRGVNILQTESGIMKKMVVK